MMHRADVERSLYGLLRDSPDIHWRDFWRYKRTEQSMDITPLLWESNPRSCQYEAVVHVTQLRSSELISEVVFSYCNNAWWKPTCMHVWFGNMIRIWHVLISNHNTIRMNEWMFIELLFDVEEEVMAIAS